MSLHLSYANFHTICLEFTVPCSKEGEAVKPTAVLLSTVLRIKSSSSRINSSQDVFKAL